MRRLLSLPKHRCLPHSSLSSTASSIAVMRRDYVHNPNQAASGEKSSEVRHLFAYGTLRPDDVKGAPWTKRFREGMVWQRARVPSARLFADRYPFVVLSPPVRDATCVDELHNGGQTDCS